MPHTIHPIHIKALSFELQLHRQHLIALLLPFLAFPSSTGTSCPSCAKRERSKFFQQQQLKTNSNIVKSNLCSSISIYQSKYYLHLQYSSVFLPDLIQIQYNKTGLKEDTNKQHKRSHTPSSVLRLSGPIVRSENGERSITRVGTKMLRVHPKSFNLCICRGVSHVHTDSPLNSAIINAFQIIDKNVEALTKLIKFKQLGQILFLEGALVMQSF